MVAVASARRIFSLCNDYRASGRGIITTENDRRATGKAERQEKQSEFFYNALDKRIDEVSKQISEARSELKTEISEVRSELSKMNQNHIDHLSHHER